jgi:hypothetical protein
VKITDFIQQDPTTGRAVLAVPGYHARFLLSCHPRDIHEMAWWQRWLFGSTPGQNLRNGVAINMRVAALMNAGLAIQATRPDVTGPRLLVKVVLHEVCGHWYKCWKIDGPGAWPILYSASSVLTMGRKGTVHPHDDVPEEILCNEIAFALLALGDAATPGTVIDTDEWLQTRYPAKR